MPTTKKHPVQRDPDLEQLEADVQEAVLAALGDLAEQRDLALYIIQPPESVLEAAATAATQAFMAFERGYRMSDDGDAP